VTCALTVWLQKEDRISQSEKVIEIEPGAKPSIFENHAWDIKNYRAGRASSNSLAKELLKNAVRAMLSYKRRVRAECRVNAVS